MGCSSLVLALVMALSLVALPSFAEGEEKDTYSVVINYVFADGSQAAPSWTATLARGSAYHNTVTSPTVVGYAPDKATVELHYTAINDDVIEIVTYKPAEVNFTIKHYQQNTDNDNYTLFETETKTGFTESEVGAGRAKSYEGFTALLYDTTTRIAADGSTEVEIYYDRNYYLLSLDLAGGWGADPIYARYGAVIGLSSPTKPGYTFAGWNPTAPANMPAGNQTLKANWTAGQSTYLVQYWLENANDDGYSYDTSVKKTASTGSKVSGSNDKSYTGFHFDRADQNVEVKGDGSTVVNVYYKRNTYTLTFKVEEGNWLHSDWQTKAEFKNIKYGADTSTWWSQAPSGYLWYTTKDGSTFYTAAPDMPNRNLVIYGNTSSGSSTVHYYEVNTTNRVRPDLTIGTSGWEFTEEDYIKIPGFTYASSDRDNYGNNYYIYYSRNSYNLDFNNNGTIVKSEKVPYEKALVEYKFVPEYPSGLEENAYTFDGWYTDPGCTVAVDWDNATMPYNNTILYAKWAPKTHTVRTFLNEEAMKAGTDPINTWANVAHRSTIEKPQNPTNGQYTFVGWFYQENGVEKAYDFSMAVTKDMDLYAKWISNSLVQYTIHYQLENGTPIAPDTTGSALAGATKTFDAKTGTDLNEGYQTGYFPNVGSHSITMDINGGNEFTFVYVPKAEVNYTVRYLEKDTNKVLHEEKHAATRDAVVTEKFETVVSYAPDAYQKRLVLSADEKENVITFWYVKDEAHAPVQIIHWVQNIAGDGYTEYSSSTNLNGLIGETYTAEWLTIAGFAKNEAKSNTSGKLTAAGLVLNLYYDRIVYPYEFRFVEDLNGTTVANSVTGAARYGSTVVQGYENLESAGYALKEGQSENAQITVTMEADKNVYTFHYMPFFNVVEVQNGVNGNKQRITMTSQHMDMARGGFSLTDMVPEGYLYGGAFEADHTTPIDFANGQSGLQFVPTCGQTYYIWEPNAAVYLKPKSLSGWEHVWKGEELKLDVNSFYLVAPVDRTYYKVVGFTVNGNVDVRDTRTNMDDQGARTSAIYESIVLPKKDGSSVTYGPTAWNLSPTDLLGCAMADENLWKDTTKTISYVPYWVTLDGVKVTGAASRTYQYVENTKGLKRTGDDKPLTSTCTYTPDEPNNAPMRLLSAYIADSTQYTVTFHDNGVETAVTVRPGSVASCQPAGVSGKLFAGWYADADCTQPADLTAVEQDMDVYAKYVSDSYLTVKYNKIGLFRPTGVNLITAVDSENFAEVGFVINGEKVPVSDYTYRYRLIFTAGSLFGGDVARKAPMVTMGYSFNGAKSVTVAPYWVTNDGTTVTGAARTLTVSGWSIKG